MIDQRDAADRGADRGAIAASCLGIVISSLLRARSERVIFRSRGSGVGAELLDSSMESGIALRLSLVTRGQTIYAETGVGKIALSLSAHK